MALVSRAVQNNWANHELATGWGRLDHHGLELDSRPLDLKKDIEYHLSRSKPSTMLTACEMLRVCMTILAHQQEDSKHTFAEGPVLEIVRSVLSALEDVRSEMAVGSEAIKQRRRCKRKS